MSAHLGSERTRQGLIYALVAYGWWGLVPLYFRAMQQVPPLEILAHRIVWSLAVLAGVITLLGRWAALRECLRSRRFLVTLVLTAGLIAVNWFVYIYAVDRRRVVQASLGYFINPLVSVFLGMLFFRERLRPLQVFALLLAAAGTLRLALEEDVFPWISFALAFSFSLYALLRKKIPIDGLTGLSVETIFLTPLALGYLVFLARDENISMGTMSLTLDLLIVASGIVTAVPLLCFGQAAQRLPLSSLGFMQYLSPTIQFLLAVWAFGEPLHLSRLFNFVLIWAALALFTFDAVQVYRKMRLVQEKAEQTPQPASGLSGSLGGSR